MAFNWVLLLLAAAGQGEVRVPSLPTNLSLVSTPSGMNLLTQISKIKKKKMHRRQSHNKPLGPCGK